MPQLAPVLIAVPSGLIVSGVATWAARLASGMAARGGRAGLILHRTPDGHAPLNMALHPAVRVFELSHLPTFEEAASEPDSAREAARESWILACLAAARAMSRDAGGGPVVISPNLHADCYGACLGAAMREPGLIRLIGWQHNDIAYDRAMLAHFAPALSAVAGVSASIVDRLRPMLPGRHIVRLPYGVEVPEVPDQRPPLNTPDGPRPLRLIYAGRLDHHQKRILALPGMSIALARRGIAHTLTIVGDGPAAPDLDRLIKAAQASGHPSTPTIIRAGSAPPGQVRRALARHDALVLPSRFEGLSVSMLEALAAGCIPIVARVASGAAEAIEHGDNGLLADVGPDDDEHAAGEALACQVARLHDLDAAAMSRRAHAVARQRYAIETHIRAASELIDLAAAAPPPPWPAGRAPWFTGVGGSIPADAPARVARALVALAGRRIIVHGAGQHTRSLLDALLGGPAVVVAFADDDRQRHGTTLAGLPVIDPADAAAHGAGDVLISTHLHEREVWSRRGVYERRGLAVHRLYAESAREPSLAL